METTSIPVYETKMIPVDQIERDPNQPRKEFNEQKFDELKASIQQNSLLQPISVRPLPDGKGYQLIYGERRTRAFQALGLKEIPAYVRDVNDETVLCMQIVENMERENLHPMEQAEAFQKYINLAKSNENELALHYGKTPQFIRQQLSLNNLVDKWKIVFRKNAIPLSLALRICTLSEDSQEDYYENEVDTPPDKVTPNQPLSINTNGLSIYKGLLSHAIFDLADPNLCPKAGACTKCPFNSGIYSLFSEDEKSPRCNNPKCFKEKTATYYSIELAKAKADPTILLVFAAHYGIPNSVEALKKDGHSVKHIDHDVSEIKKPQPPNLEEIKSDCKKRKSNVDKALKSANEIYSFQSESFEKQLKAGIYKKAFVVESPGSRPAGSYIFVKDITKETKTPTKVIQDKIKSDAASIEEIQSEINRIEINEIRAKQLDAEKVQKRISEAIVQSPEANTVPKRYLPAFDALLTYVLIETLSTRSRSVIEKAARLPVLKSGTNRKEYFQNLAKTTKEFRALLVFQIIMDRYHDNLPNDLGGFMLRTLAEQFSSIPIATFEKDQQTKAKQRQDNVNKRLTEIKSHIPKPKNNTRTNRANSKRKTTRKALQR
ncbi:ParB/RepB/Spo0J family partition protein [Paraflavitalea sp. CAU 1676]|uniref:ParB/RepB/Spo0J family partition protein n=1 Tax=Paraflavitalea sp. CAU 1676 TaxID=3032598 RepID=UPI0023DC79C1|nr:ParB/RepB/Spo0J family partition protein [Paraflavitalea sp. CAU 1676]MDF2191379.1 ParB/RepB/Spo0J family partition protein [Paraflavitalea sp. CAU 1676]